MLVPQNVFRAPMQGLKPQLTKNRTRAAAKVKGGSRGQDEGSEKYASAPSDRIAAASFFTSLAYGMAYSDSQNAINGLSVSCETTIRIYHHPPSSDHPFSHFLVTFGIKNPSSTDVNAHWLVSASDPSQNYYNANGDASFTIPRRASSHPQVSIFIG